MEVADAAAVDFGLHAEGFGQVQDLHEWGEAADVTDAGADDVTRAGLDRLRAWNILPSTVSGPQMASDVRSHSHTYEDMLCSSIGSSIHR